MAASHASMKKSVVKEFQCFLFFSEADAKSCMLHAAQMHACLYRLRCALSGDLEAQSITNGDAASDGSTDMGSCKDTTKPNSPCSMHCKSVHSTQGEVSKAGQNSAYQ